ncbi:ATP-binding cassette domain-containing protein [Thermosediminibacter oceani]|uniref:ABC transporter ATP-binding protein n=1 Tax=Thermosediminibacter oceani (strain ATCC BAA-1034 / DSM 16646 / JW/IW-1228P) TaxID=555079 RepID=D9S1T2_THEOJ|nr:ATP-binding cassette domain-containing protein [Thermosediminibacter oceani]ADL07359.1 cobalt ABC transporter, ATPase subunit [Thermosediminibacter oceani DSM 16646]
MDHIIQVEDLHYRYKDGTEALRGLSLFIERGRKVALLGPNGAGKSTLLLHFNGIYLPQRGRVYVAGREVTAETEYWVRSRVGLVFQDPDDQVFSSTVEEDVAFGPRNLGLAPAEIEERVRAALDAVGMQAYRHKPPYHLSYGQKKRVAIAGVLAMVPEIIVMDEPMAYLDPAGQAGVRTILDELHRQGKTLIVATHDVDFAASWAEVIIILKEGRVLAYGGPELLLDENVVAAAGLRLPLIAQVFHGFIPEQSRLPRDVQSARMLLNSLLTHSAENC